MTKQVAFVFESFSRAGSQKHIVEIIKGIQAFRPSIECTLFLISYVVNEKETFLPEIAQTNVKIQIRPYRFLRVEGQSIFARSWNKFSRLLIEKRLNHSFYKDLSKFRFVVCAQPFVAELLLPSVKPHQRMCFHLMEHLAQRSASIYVSLLKHRNLHLIYMHSSQQMQLSNHHSPNPTITWPIRLCSDHLKNTTFSVAESAGPLKIAHYSRISPMRLIDQIIDAFALLHQRTSAQLRIAGYIEDPVYHQNLQSQIRRLGISDAVQFVDPVPSPAEDPARSDVDLVWMISLSGHIGYAGIEAMAAGWPTLLLEVDSRAHGCPADPELSSLICATPTQLVERSLALQADSSTFRQQQAKLLRDRFITTQEAIDELTAFYLGSNHTPHRIYLSSETRKQAR